MSNISRMSTAQSTASSVHHRRESGIFRTSKDRRSASVVSEDTLVSVGGRPKLLTNNHQRTGQISPFWIRLLVEEKPTARVNSNTKADVPACVTTIVAVANSLTGWSQLSDNVAMFQEAWDLTPYEKNETIFPIANVPNKAFVLTELVELINRHQASEYHIPLEQIAAGLLRLQKIIEGDSCSSILSSSDSLEIASLQSGLPDATILTGGPSLDSSSDVGQQGTHSISTTHSSSATTSTRSSNATASSKKASVSQAPAPGPMISTFAGTFPSSYSSSVSAERSSPAPRSLRNFRKSLLHRLSLKKRQSRPISAPENLDPNPVTRTASYKPVSIPEKPSEDLRAMYIYQAQLSKLAHSITSLPRAQQTLFLFAFLESVVCPFVLEDCQALLASCVKTQILDKL